MDAMKEDVGDNDHEHGMQCSEHPYNRNNQGGICAFCLKEKLGKLVSSPSFPLPVRASASASASSSPSPFGSNVPSASNVNGGGGGCGVISSTTTTTSLLSSLAVNPSTCYTKKARLPFLLAKRKKKMVSTSRADLDIVLKRSRSTTTPRRNHFMDIAPSGADFSHSTKKCGFWSFLYMSPSSKSTTTKTTIAATTTTRPTTTSATNGSTVRSNDKCLRDNNVVVVEEGDNSVVNGQATERKVSRSRSVGCGSRSFSGHFFERISTGCGDCTSLRRVESQREGKAMKVHRGATTNPNIKEKVKCGGLFGGFNINSSSSSSFSSSSSSSSYWVSSSGDDAANNGKSSRAGGDIFHSRNRSWGWALASPMRAFSKQCSKDGNKTNKIIRESCVDKKTTPNLSAIPSLLAS